MEYRKKQFTALLAGFATLSATSANATLLAYLPFDGGTVGQTLSDTASTGSGTSAALGFVTNFDAITNVGNGVYVDGLSGSLPSSGNAFQAATSFRLRAILDRTTPEFTASNLIGTDTLIGGGTVAGSLFGSLLISNPNGDPNGFTGLEFAAGSDATRVLTIGEALNDTGTDFIVLDDDQAGEAGGPADIPLPAASAATREVVFRIDYTSGADTFTLLNSDGSDGASGTGSFQFATLHLAAFTAAPGVVYDEIRLGTTLADVSGIPEPSTALLAGLGILGLIRRRR